MTILNAMNDPLLNTAGISTKVALQARCYGNGVDIVVVDMQHRILLRSALSFDNWGKFVSGREAVEMATMHAPVLHDLVNQALAPLDHKVQIVPVEKATSAPSSSLEARAEPFFTELFRLLQKHRVSLDVDTALGVHFDDTYQPSGCLLSEDLGIADSATGIVLDTGEQERVVENALKAAWEGREVDRDRERDLETNEIASKVTMDGVLSEAKSIFVERMDVNGNGAVGIDLSGPPRTWAPAKPEASCKPTDPAPIDYSLAPVLVDVKGMHRHRLADNPEEKRFAAAFERDFINGHSNLRYLLRPASEQSTHAFGLISDRDREVAATMIQWLGSPVGQCFLSDLGYEKCAPGPVKRRPASGTSI